MRLPSICCGSCLTVIRLPDVLFLHASCEAFVLSILNFLELVSMFDILRHSMFDALSTFTVVVDRDRIVFATNGLTLGTALS